MFIPCSVFHPYSCLRSFRSSACDMFHSNYKSSLCHVCSCNLNIDFVLSCTLYLTLLLSFVSTLPYTLQSSHPNPALPDPSTQGSEIPRYVQNPWTTIEGRCSTQAEADIQTPRPENLTHDLGTQPKNPRT